MILLKQVLLCKKNLCHVRSCWNELVVKCAAAELRTQGSLPAITDRRPCCCCEHSCYNFKLEVLCCGWSHSHTAHKLHREAIHTCNNGRMSQNNSMYILSEPNMCGLPLKTKIITLLVNGGRHNPNQLKHHTIDIVSERCNCDLVVDCLFSILPRVSRTTKCYLELIHTWFHRIQGFIALC